MLFYNEIIRLASVFLNLGYPRFLLDRILNRFLAKQHSDRLVCFGPMLRLLFVRLPFMGVLSNNIYDSFINLYKLISVCCYQ